MKNKLVEELMNYDAHRIDTVVQLKSVRCYPRDDGHLGINAGEEQGITAGSYYGITRWAVGQLATRLELPGGYINKCPAFLASYNLNYWIGEVNKVLVKLCIKTCASPLIIGLVTTKYHEYQNIEFYEDITRSLDAIEYTIPGYNLSDVCLDVSVGLPEYIDNHGYGVGMHLRNSEVGYASASISTILYGPGIYIPLDSFIKGSSSTMIHLRKDHEGFKSSIHDLITNIAYKWQDIINVYIQSANHAITILDVRNLITEHRLPKAILDNKLGIEVFSKTTSEDKEVVLKDIIDAINEEAGKIKYPRKWDIQKIGGTVLGELTEALLWN